MAEEKHAAKSRKIVDVAHPGKTAPSPNSRSVIISHRPIMRDPMMSADLPETAKAEDEASTTVSVTRASGGVLQPLADSKLGHPDETPKDEAPAKDEPADEAKEAEKTDEAPAEATESESDPEAEADAETEPEAKEEEKPVAKSPKADKAEAPATGSAGTDAKLGTKDVQSDVQIAAAEEAEAKRQAHMQELIETKKYYLPINTVEKQRTKQFVAAGIILSVLLAALWLDIALDAGLVKLGHLHALTHFFN